MGRRHRTLKPSIIEDEKVGPISDSAFRLFTSLIVMADDHGNVRAAPRWLTMQIWWGHDDPPNVLGLLGELNRVGLIEPYNVHGNAYVHLPGWSKHQRIDNAGRPDVPGPAESDHATHEDEIDAGHGAGDDQHAAGNGAGCASAASRRESPTTAASRGSDLDPDRNKSGERARARSPKGSRIPDDWIPDSSAISKATELEIDVNFQSELFRQHYKSTGEIRQDWNAAFLKWLLKCGEMSSRKPTEPTRIVKEL